MGFVTSGSAAITSVGFMAYSPMRPAHRSPARPCSQTAVSTASRAGIWHSSAAEHARQHVTAAALGHTGITGTQHRRVPVRECADRLRPFAHDGAAVPDGKSGRRLCPAGCIRTRKAGKLPIVRCEDDGRAGAIEHRHILRDGKKRVGVEHERRAGAQNDGLHQRRECGIPRPRPGPSTHTSLLRSRSSSSGSASAVSLPSADGSGNGIAASFFTAVTA